MILQQMVEMLNESFPKMSLVECKLKLNDAQRFFARKTRCQIADVLMIESDFVNGRALLDREIESVRSVGFVDANLALVESSGWKFDVKDRYVYLTDDTGSLVSTFPSNAASLRVRVVELPGASNLTNLDQSPMIPAEFHEALVWKVLSDKAITAGNVELAKMAKEKFHEFIVEGIRYGKIEADRTGIIWKSNRNPVATGISLDDDRDL